MVFRGWGAWTASRCFDTGERKAGPNSARRQPKQHVSTSGLESHGKGEPWRGTKPMKATGSGQVATPGRCNGLTCGEQSLEVGASESGNALGSQQREGKGPGDRVQLQERGTL
jgi:hypothetical protein